MSDKILLRNCRFIITQDSRRRILENKSILIEGNRIIKVSSNIKAKKDYDVVDCSENVVMPGLINMHSHVPMNIMRGWAPGLELKEWLNQIFKREAKLTKKDVYLGSRDAFNEFIKSGVTTTVDMYFKIEEIYKAAVESGIRAFLGYGMIDLFNDDKKALEERRTKEVVKFIRSKNNELIQPIVSPHAPNTCSKDLLIWSRKFADENKILLGIHAGETKGEVELIKRKHHRELTRFLDSIGLLDNSILFHGVHLDYNYIKKVGRKPSIVHCPSSNLKLKSGMLNIYDVVRSGSNLCLGTDGVASNNNLDLLEEMKIAAMLFKVHQIEGRFKDVFIDQLLIDAVTINPAKALKLNAGFIKEGKLADLTILSLNNHLSNSTKKTILNNIVYAANSSDVKATIINGKKVYENECL